MKEYDIHEHEVEKKYRHAAVAWYQKRHIARVQGWEDTFNTPMPPKDWNERLELTKSQLKYTQERVRGNFYHLAESVTNKSIGASATYENAKEKYKDKAIVKKLTSVFKKKKKEEPEESKKEEPEEIKKEDPPEESK